MSNNQNEQNGMIWTGRSTENAEMGRGEILLGQIERYVAIERAGILYSASRMENGERMLLRNKV